MCVGKSLRVLLAVALLSNIGIANASDIIVMSNRMRSHELRENGSAKMTQKDSPVRSAMGSGIAHESEKSITGEPGSRADVHRVGNDSLKVNRRQSRSTKDNAHVTQAKKRGALPKRKRANAAKSGAADETRKNLPDTNEYRVRVAQSKERSIALLNQYLADGQLAEGEAALLAELKLYPQNDQARFGVGVIEFLRAIEQLAQDLHRYGVRDVSHGLSLPFLRLPIPVNSQPESVSYSKIRKVFDTLVNGLSKAESTLASISDKDVKLPVSFGMIRLDLNGDGRGDDCETLWKVYSSIQGNRMITLEQAKNFSITFDRGDVHWLRGYCHLLTAMCQVYLAYDSRESFECTAHLLFTKVENPYAFLTNGKHVHDIDGDTDIVDLIALIHLIRWHVTEPERMQSALHHLEEMVRQSRYTWSYYLAETDDDHEWIPNPRQTGVIPNVHVTNEMVCAWTDLMNQIEQLLAGKLLIAFWRGDDGRGINLRRVFTEPRTLDLVLWVQGPAAAPYLEKGNTTKITTWRNLRSAFGDQFPGFAIWFN